MSKSVALVRGEAMTISGSLSLIAAADPGAARIATSVGREMILAREVMAARRCKRGTDAAKKRRLDDSRLRPSGAPDGPGQLEQAARVGARALRFTKVTTWGARRASLRSRRRRRLR